MRTREPTWYRTTLSRPLHQRAQPDFVGSVSCRRKIGILVPIDPLRTAAIRALFDDELLPQAFALKGGTALKLHGIGQRGSLDLDFSIPSDLSDPARVATVLEASLVRKYAELGYEVFDFRFGPRPSSKVENTPEWWGGYECNFKVIPKGGVSLTLRREASRRYSNRPPSRTKI